VVGAPGDRGERLPLGSATKRWQERERHAGVRSFGKGQYRRKNLGGLRRSWGNTTTLVEVTRPHRDGVPGRCQLCEGERRRNLLLLTTGQQIFTEPRVIELCIESRADGWLKIGNRRRLGQKEVPANSPAITGNGTVRTPRILPGLWIDSEAYVNLFVVAE